MTLSLVDDLKHWILVSITLFSHNKDKPFFFKCFLNKLLNKAKKKTHCLQVSYDIMEKFHVTLWISFMGPFGEVSCDFLFPF